MKNLWKHTLLSYESSKMLFDFTKCNCLSNNFAINQLEKIIFNLAYQKCNNFVVIAIFSQHETMHSKGCHIILKGLFTGQIIFFCKYKDYINILAYNFYKIGSFYFWTKCYGILKYAPCNSFKQGDINILDEFAWNVWCFNTTRNC